MTCKDCIHWQACRNTAYEYAGEDAASAYDEDSCCKRFAETCSNFSDKSEWFHFPIKDCKTAYYALGHGSSARVLKEPIYGVAIKNGKCHIVDECEDLYEIGKTVFLTKEKAKKKLNGGKIND